MTHNTEAERAEFEAHAFSEGWAYQDPQYGVVFYDHLPKVIAWKAWQAARRAPEAPVISEATVLAITTAYEQGVGKGHQSHARKEAITNPYSDEWGCDSAWQMGYDEGREQAERKAASTLPPDAAQSNSAEFDIIKTEAAPVQMPEPAARTTSHDGEFYWDNHLVSHGSRFGASLYTEQQVRQLLAAKVKQGG